jgi:hydroxypyruvate reductase
MLRDDALRILDAALEAVDPVVCVRQALKPLNDELRGARRVFVIGAGKAAGLMAQAAEEALGDHIHAGWVNTKYGHGVKLERIVCHECGHPVPDEAGVEGSRRIAALARSAGEGDIVLCLISGGASALMPLPVDGVTLAEKQDATRHLLACGATIHQINAVRKHLSAIKGGRLAQMAAPAKVISLILSDVIGDNLDVIGSGPTVPDSSTLAMARAALGRDLPAAQQETPKPGDPVFAKVRNILVGSNRQALTAAQHKARNLGFHTLLLSSTIQGETRDVAAVHAEILKEVVATGNPIARPACLLSGGETTVTLRGSGKGGRNQEFALAAAFGIAGLRDVLVLSAGTDGTDGPTDAAGAFADGATIERGVDAERHLNENDAYPFFESLGDLLITGPTRTNVMDLHILLAH